MWRQLDRHMSSHVTWLTVIIKATVLCQPLTQHHTTILHTHTHTRTHTHALQATMNAFQALLASLLDEMKTWPEFAAFQHWSDGEGTVVAGGKQPLVPDATKEIAASTDVPKEVAAAAADAAKEIEAAITSAEGKGEAEATKLAQVQAGSNADGKARRG